LKIIINNTRYETNKSIKKEEQIEQNFVVRRKVPTVNSEEEFTLKMVKTVVIVNSSWKEEDNLSLLCRRHSLTIIWKRSLIFGSLILLEERRGKCTCWRRRWRTLCIVRKDIQEHFDSVRVEGEETLKKNAVRR